MNRSSPDRMPGFFTLQHTRAPGRSLGSPQNHGESGSCRAAVTHGCPRSVVVAVPAVAAAPARDEVRREGRALSEEELLALGHPDLLALRAREIEPVLVHEHLRVLEPHLP